MSLCLSKPSAFWWQVLQPCALSMCSSLQPQLRGGCGRGELREGRRNHLAPGAGSSQVKCLSGHVGRASRKKEGGVCDHSKIVCYWSRVQETRQ